MACPRTIPLLIYDEHRKEEINTDSEDHAADSCSYGLKEIKFLSPIVGTFGGDSRVNVYLPEIKERGLDLKEFETAKEEKEVD